MNQPNRVVWTSKIVWMTVLAVVLLVAPGRAGAEGGNGALKVTSFPTGASVSVDNWTPRPHRLTGTNRGHRSNRTDRAARPCGACWIEWRA